MAPKRACRDVEPCAQPGTSSKRPRQSPQEGSNGPAPSNGSTSADSTLRSSPTVSGTRQSSVSSLPSTSADDEEDAESSLSSSSEESSVLDTDEDEIVTLGQPKKPHIAGGAALSGARDLQARISALLPQLAAANHELETNGVGAGLEDVEDGEQHIEMDLGLGVLEEKREGDESSSGSDEEIEVEDAAGDAAEGEQLSPGREQRRAGKDSSVLNKLMGREKPDTKPGIEELG